VQLDAQGQRTRSAAARVAAAEPSAAVTALRLTGGHARGRVVTDRVPDGVRPTSSRVREALFSVIGPDLTGTSMLDAFSGTGLMALEAWSRGARVTAVERQPAVFRQLEGHLRALGSDIVAVQGDVLCVLSDEVAFDGVFADPPYADAIGPILSALAPRARDWLVVEQDARATLPLRWDGMVCDRPRRYGDTALWVYRRVSATGDL
jgi:16S rRNA (guanine(966)-N(2))-methyltransferase RsmD